MRSKQADYCEARFNKAWDRTDGNPMRNGDHATFWARMEYIYLHPDEPRPGEELDLGPYTRQT